MIRIRIRESEGKVQGIRVSGHSEAAEHGKDIVCAAVSVLVQTTLLGVVDQIGRKIPYEMSSGNLAFDLPKDLSQEEAIRTEALMKTLYIGLKNLRKSYRKYITITTEEV